MLCPSCNTPNRDDAKFCKKCGHPLHSEQAKTPDAATSASAETAPVSVAASEGVAAQDDISTAPTQIISPQQMMEMQARRWQQDAERGQQPVQVASENANVNGNSITASPPANSVPEAVSIPSTPVQQQAQQDVADMPTVIFDPASDYPSNNDASSPDESASVTEDASTPAAAEAAKGDVTKETEAATAATPVTADTTMNEKQTPTGDNRPVETNEIPEPEDGAAPKEEQNVIEAAADQPDEQVSDFPVLTVGTTLAGRYEISQVISDEPAEHLYMAIDHQGYQRCWNCGSTENREGDEFCIDCGAGLLDASYMLHEYPTEQNANAGAEAQVLHENIVNTFVDQGHTYAVAQEQAVENAFPNGVHLDVASDSDAGDIRRSDPNEDSTLVMMFQRIHESISSPLGVFIIADGMGGHDNGQMASRLAVSTIAERMSRDLLLAPLTSENAGEAAHSLDEEQLVGLLQGAVEDANAAICKINQRDKTDMGSTITGCMVAGDYAYILNVGDSRTYMTRGDQIYRLTTDHSLVQQLVAGGLIEPDEVYTHPQRSQIFRSLGDKLNVQVDIFKQQLHPGDKLLCCCDGLWEMVRDPQIESILNTAPNPQAACTQLIDAANANGGEDNISAVVVYVH
jgi:serine/threonine protein phosphatase PrpC